MKKVKNAWPVMAFLLALASAMVSMAGTTDFITEVWRKNASTPCQASTCKLTGAVPCPSDFTYFSEAACPNNRQVAAYEPN